MIPTRDEIERWIVTMRDEVDRLHAALDEARADRDKANGLVKRMEHDNRVIARELDCSWGGSASPEHECKEDNPCLARQYQDAEERLEATATFLERATTRQCYLAKQAAEAERDAAETQAWDALGRPEGTHDTSNVQRLCEAHIALKAKLAEARAERLGYRAEYLELLRRIREGQLVTATEASMRYEGIIAASSEEPL